MGTWRQSAVDRSDRRARVVQPVTPPVLPAVDRTDAGSSEGSGRATGPVLVIVLVALMVACTAVATWRTHDLVTSAENRSLEAQAGTAGAYVQSTFSSADVAPELAASAVALSGGKTATFGPAARIVLEGSHIPLTLTLVGPTGQGLASAGTPAPVDRAAAGQAARQTGGVLSTIRGADGRLHVCSTVKVAGTGMTVQAYYPPLAQVTSGGLLPDIALHLYAGSPTEPGQLLLARGPSVTSRQIIRTSDIEGLRLTVVVQASKPSDSALTRSLPWLVLAGGLVLSAGVLLVFEMLQRARRRALRLVEMRTAELDHLAYHDELTGLANRRLLWRGLEEVLNTPPGRVAVVCIDVDHFKELNDHYGHAVGDAVLRAVASRLTAAVRTGDLVARLGGDEFVALCGGVADGAEAEELATRIQLLVSAPLDVGEGTVSPSVSVGVHLTDGDSTIDDCLRQADQALYRAKTEGRGRHHLGRVPYRE